MSLLLSKDLTKYFLIEILVWGVFFCLGFLEPKAPPRITPYTRFAAEGTVPHFRRLLMFKEIFSGMAQRVRLENSLQLQRAKHIRPAQIRLEVAVTLNDIDSQLDADAKLKARFESTTIVVPE